MSNPPESFNGDWITPDHPSYSEAIARWAANAQRRAKAVAFVKTAQDVATVLKYAKQSKFSIAIRGGGHSTGGASSIEDGIVVDLSRHLSSVKVDPIEKLAYVGGGAIWETVDKEAIQHGLATVGGTVNHVNRICVSLLLGGGYGFLSGEHGLVIDNLVKATVVTARGDILTTSSTENPDLFWGIRGAGCNFGVVTEFVLRLHPQRRTVFGGILAYPLPLLKDVVTTLAKSWESGLSEKEAITFAQTADPAGNPLALFVLFWNGSEEEGRSHFKPFFDLGPVMDTCKELPYEELNSIQNFNVQHGKNYYVKGVFSSGIQLDVAEKLASRIPELTKGRYVSLTVVHEFLPTKKILSVPSDATAHIRGPRANILLLAGWPGDGKDTDKLDVVRSATTELRQIIIQGERDIPESRNTGYGNYEIDPAVKRSASTAVSAQELFGSNYAKLQKLKKKYDPDLVFFKWNPITPEA
ncbi:FAD-binding domain-containing protein [Russula dissimulans]|nr:FAD-binding domain-containing protein [Russula dissimulans]